MCAGGTLSTERHVLAFVGRHCQVLTSSLIINLGSTPVLEADLKAAFSAVLVIQGGLYVTNSHEVPVLDYFSALVEASVVYITGSTGLVDARLPMLSPSVEVIVRNNRRLCPGNYPRGAGNCSLIDVRAQVAVPTVPLEDFTAVEQARISTVLGALISTPHEHVYISDVTTDGAGRLQVTVAVATSVDRGLQLRAVWPLAIDTISLMRLGTAVTVSCLTCLGAELRRRTEGHCHIVWLSAPQPPSTTPLLPMCVRCLALGVILTIDRRV